MTRNKHLSLLYFWSWMPNLHLIWNSLLPKPPQKLTKHLIPRQCVSHDGLQFKVLGAIKKWFSKFDVGVSISSTKLQFNECFLSAEQVTVWKYCHWGQFICPFLWGTSKGCHIIWINLMSANLLIHQVGPKNHYKHDLRPFLVFALGLDPPWLAIIIV